VEYDGTADALFSMQRRNRNARWLLFTRGIIDKLLSFIISGRTTYTAATRHLSADVSSFGLRRQDVVKLGTAAIKTFRIPAETARCPLCGPSPEFVVIDAQALGCSDPDDTTPFRPAEDCPVLNLPAPKLCVLEHAPLRAAVTRVLRTSTPLNSAQVTLLRTWHGKIGAPGRPSPEAAAAELFFRFFPIGHEKSTKTHTAGRGVAQNAADTAAALISDNRPTKRGRFNAGGGGLEDALRLHKDGAVVLGGKGPPVTKPTDTWRNRTGLCAPAFHRYPRDDDGLWICVRPFLQAMLTETVSGMFHAFDERAVRLLANTLRLMRRGAWRSLTKAVDGVGFVAGFLGWFAGLIDEDRYFRQAVGVLLLAAVNVENYVDETFKAVSNNKSTLAAGWRNAEYCKRWKGKPTSADYKRWRAEQVDLGDIDEDDPLVSYEYFAGLPRVRPGITDSEAAKRRVRYRGKDRHKADLEGEGDACNKAFSIKAGLTQGVFNVVCPHVITLGFRCLFRAESVKEALSIVLERFAKLPKAIFYDVACKLDKNAMRRVRQLMRGHGVRCILDRPHSITHSCSPIYMPDECLGTTAGVATQAAEVSHSIAVVNRTSLAYMSPSTYMYHRMVQVAFVNLRKLYRLHAGNGVGENDHVPLAAFFHSKVLHQCERATVCTCASATGIAGGVDATAPPAGMDVTAPSAGMDATAQSAGMDANAPSARMEAAASSAGSRSTLSGGQGGEEPQPGRANAAPELDLGGGEDSVVGPTAQVEKQEPWGFDVDEDDGIVPLNAVPGVDASAGGAVDDGPVADKVDGLTVLKHTLLLEKFNEWVAARASHEHNALDTGPVTLVQRRLVSELIHRPLGKAIRPLNKARILLRGSDSRRLRREAWLNDELMNSFAALINYRSAAAHRARGSLPVGSGTPLRTVMFNTFFFSRLSARSGFVDYNGVSRWGAKLGLNLEAVDVILVPILVSGVHWALVSIDVGARAFRYYESLSFEDSRGAVPVLKCWLHDELTTRLGHSVSAEWGVAGWRVVLDPDLPRQTDGGSCGIFVLAAADCFSLGAPLRFSQDNIGALRRRIALALLFDDLEFPDSIFESTSGSATSTPAVSDDESEGRTDPATKDGGEVMGHAADYDDAGEEAGGLELGGDRVESDGDDGDGAGGEDGEGERGREQGEELAGEYMDASEEGVEDEDMEDRTEEEASGWEEEDVSEEDDDRGGGRDEQEE